MKSCVGCGDDWKKGRWSYKDLAHVWIEDEEFDVCPDCLQEVSMMYRVRFTKKEEEEDEE